MPTRHIAIVTPLLDDWPSLELLLGELAGLGAQGCSVSVLVVDDGSTTEGDTPRLAALASRLAGLSIVRLACNLGHQRAIAVGLVEAARRAGHDFVVVMDSDGEDRPEDILRLIAEHEAHPEAIVVANRAERSEGVGFRLGYSAYKAAFRLGTGVAIDFGNFCLIPGALLPRLVARPELWNHLAATLVRSRTSLRRVPTARGRRYAGQSSMNLVALVAHGLSAISVFATEVFVRFLVLTLLLVGVTGAVIAAAIGLRIFTELAIPGWATNVVGLSLVVLLQLATLMLALTFVMLSNRTAAPVVPVEFARHYIRRIDVLR
ncbi:glycosyltransferase [Falsiroseomonas sp. HW251]|uniref:glycosyltransferase n=1 Tax=Falsiroseomonas sp. HW251 TaxID=3390998 RepID=UPI003D3230C8